MWWCFIILGLFLFGIVAIGCDEKYMPLAFIGCIVFSMILMLICKSMII